MDDNLIVITAEESGERIDALLARCLEEFSRSAIQRLIEQGNVSLSGRPIKKITNAPQETVFRSSCLSWKKPR